jgi:hypothetical protein
MLSIGVPMPDSRRDFLRDATFGAALASVLVLRPGASAAEAVKAGKAAGVRIGIPS